MHIYQIFRAIYSSINSPPPPFFLGGGRCSSCINLNGAMLISPQYKQFKLINPDIFVCSANKIELCFYFYFSPTV